MVSSAQHLEELNWAPVDVLSLHAVAKDVSNNPHRVQWQSNIVLKASIRLVVQPKKTGRN